MRAGPAIAQRRGGGGDGRWARRCARPRDFPRSDEQPMPTDHQRARPRAWFEQLRDRICAAFERLEDELAGTASRPAGRPLRAHGLAAARPRTATAAAASWRSCAAGCSRRSASTSRPCTAPSAEEFRKQIPGAADERPLLGQRHQPGRPSALAAGAGGAHEHPPHRHQPELVRRRRRPDADVSRDAREDAADFHAALQGRLRPPRSRLLPALQEMVRRVFLPAAPQRAARRRRHLLRQSRQRRLGPGLRLHPRRRRGLPRRLSARSCAAT